MVHFKLLQILLFRCFSSLTVNLILEQRLFASLKFLIVNPPKGVFVILHKLDVNPHSGCFIELRATSLKMHVACINRVQWLVIRIAVRRKRKSCVTCRKYINLCSVEEHGLRSDMIKTSKIMRGLTRPNSDGMARRAIEDRKRNNFVELSIIL